MATLPNPLPKLATDITGAALGLRLPPGRLVDATDEGPWHEPLLWLADEPAAPGAWTALEPARRTAGLLPVVIEAGGSQGDPEGWELMPGEMSYPGDHDAEEVLEDFWYECAAQEDGEHTENGADGANAEDTEEGEWPGLAAPPATTDSPDPDSLATDIADALVEDGGPLKDPRLALVPARRSADIPAAIGWSGPMNHENDTARLCAVLRSWEDRFGIRVVALGFDHLLLSVASPPTTLAEAEAVAAEHFAFCPDNIWQGNDTTLRAYAENQLLNQPVWHFWWD
ncbi:DUF4253 domain-containing protein [Streptomyces sp. HD]|uniref:DUF4253 domain-containing protein n=1 Tax=Streptomyces sp. HD TaxID=3020892 RepID=UPI0023304ABE|nr:DUF4253 domain-containing protein [Streptomyces sp. HD]MDC0767445.1 DUF4253 domain-containing protein [Streptomyces sp. HD]